MALRSRDRTCRFPGCNRTWHLQAHHIEHWAKGGQALKEANRRHGLDITADTVDCFWDGELMDCHMAVDALLSYEDALVEEE